MDVLSSVKTHPKVEVWSPLEILVPWYFLLPSLVFLLDSYYVTYHQSQ